ncbi:ABC transporter substrate-binding protein [Actinacidiphila sp. bgisy144]|uniref:ABC transporter substrate-binding protein n=1 Tax=Actinacidiphila sp. bgisy144 TaxID=3413791 RepID=UPI003EBCB446
MTMLRPRRPSLVLGAIATATASALLLTACGSSAGGSNSSGSQGGSPQTGGTLTFYDPVQYEDWQTTNSLWSVSQVTDNIGERLIWQDPKTGKLLPWLATSWSVSADHKTYTFHLKPDVKFTDGTALTSQVVKDNFDQHGFGDKKLGIPADQFWNGYAGTKVVDPTTFQIRLNTPDAGFLQVLSNYRASTILAESYVKLNLAGQSKVQNWVGTGPFRYAGGDGVNEVVLKPNPHYTSWPTGSAHTGRAYLNEIDFKYVPEESTRIGALQSGQAQVVRNLSPTDEQTVGSFGGQLESFGVQGETNALAVQVRPGLITDDKQVRLALNAATDRKEINQAVLSSNYGIPIGPLVKGTPDAPDLSSYLAYDPGKAKQLLESAGWAAKSDGYRYKGGQQLHFDIWVAPFYQVSEQVLEVLQSEWKKVGVKLSIHSVSLDQYEAISAAGGTGSEKFSFSQSQTSTADPNVLRVDYDTTRANGLGQDAKSPDPKLNQLVRDQAEAFDPAKRAATVKEAGEYLYQQGYSIPLYDETQVFGLSSKVHGFGTESTARAWLYDTWLGK